MREGNWETQKNCAIFFLSFFFSQPDSKETREIIENEDLHDTIINILDSTNYDVKVFILESFYRLVQQGYDFSGSLFLSEEMHDALISCSECGIQIIETASQSLLSIMQPEEDSSE